MVAVKKKKKSKKAVQHKEPDTSKLDLEAGPPPGHKTTPQETIAHAAAAAVQSPGTESPDVESPWSTEPREQQREGEDYLSRYHVSDSEEFRNHWEGDEPPSK